jgi:hypothetical protein
MPQLEKENKKETQNGTTSGIVEDNNQFKKRYEKFSPEHKKHMALKDRNPLRPKAEENMYLFR